METSIFLNEVKIELPQAIIYIWFIWRYCTKYYSSTWYWVLSKLKTDLSFTKEKIWLILLFCWFLARLTMLFSSYVIVHRWESGQHLKIQRRSISKSLFTCWGLADPKWVNWNKNYIFFLLIMPPDIFYNFYLTCLYLPVSWSISECFSSLLVADSCRQFLLSNCTQIWKWNRNDEMASSFHIFQITQLKTLRTAFHELLEATKSGFWAKFMCFNRFGQVFSFYFSKAVPRHMYKLCLFREFGIYSSD